MTTFYLPNIRISSRIGALILSIILIVFIELSGVTQTTGDFRSKATGDWTTVNSWQTYNGTSWQDATSYPGQNSGTYTVTILAGHTITISSIGITTQEMGDVTISGSLNLTGGASSIVNYSLNTKKVIITAALTPYATINFMAKADLLLPLNAIIIASTGGLTGDCNNNQDIYIGIQKYAACNGAPGNIFTFAELMAGGGTINADITANATSCLESGIINLHGSNSGAYDSTPTYNWTGTNPEETTITFSPDAINKNVSFTPDVSGTYSISFTVSTINEGTTYSNTETITIDVSKQSTNPTSATASATTICNGSSTSLSLNGGGGGTNEVIKWYSGSCGGTLVGTGNNISVSPTVNTTYYGRYENPSPCSFNTTCSMVSITVNPTSVGGTTSSNQAICIGSSPSNISLTDNIGTIQWQSSPDNITFSDISGATATPLTTVQMGNVTTTTYFKAVVTNGTCPAANSNVATITVNPLPNVTAEGDTKCLGTSASISASGATSYSWCNGSSGTPITVTPSSTTIYTVTGTDANGCVNTANATVTINPVPTIIAWDNKATCPNDNVTLSASGGNSYVWNTTETTSSISVSPIVTTTYTVTGYNEYNCFSSSQVHVYVSTDATAITAGDWNNPNTWSINVVPNECSNVIIESGVTVNLNSTANVINVVNNGTLNINTEGTLNSSGTITNNATGTLNILGTVNATTGFNFSTIGNTVNYQSSTTNQAVIITEYNNLGILNTAEHTATISNNVTVSGNLTITGILQSTTQNLYIGGNFINNGTFTHNNGEVIFNGITAQCIGGTTITTFANITVNNTNANITLNNPVLLSGVLTLTNGIIDAASYGFTFQSSATVLGASNASHIKGLIKKITSSTTSFVFPTGDGTNYRPTTITNPSDNTWSSRYYNWQFGNEYNVCPTDIPKLNHVSDLEYWDIQPETPGGSSQISLSWNNNSEVLFPEFLLIAHWNSTNSYWENTGAVTIDSENKTITSNNPITSFSPFTLGTNNEDGSLPIELVTIDARCGVDNCITITWTTSSEENNNFYTIYKSNDGINWKKITQIPGAGTSKTFKSYKYTDNTPINYNAYYKLEQTDYNGRSEEFDVMCVFCQDILKEISISPIPAKDFINLNFYNVTHTIDLLTIYIYNQYGQISDIQYFQSTSDDNSHRIILPENLIDGNYFLKVKFGNVDFYSAVFIKKSSNIKKSNYIADLMKLGF